MCIQYTITMASTRTPSAPGVTMQQNTQQVPAGQVPAGFPTGLQPPGLAPPGLPASPGLLPPPRFPLSHPSHPLVSHPSHPPPTHMAVGVLPPQMPPPGYQEENLRYNPHRGYNSAYYENRPLTLIDLSLTMSQEDPVSLKGITGKVVVTFTMRITGIRDKEIVLGKDMIKTETELALTVIVIIRDTSFSR